MLVSSLMALALVVLDQAVQHALVARFVCHGHLQAMLLCKFADARVIDANQHVAQPRRSPCQFKQVAQGFAAGDDQCIQLLILPQTR